MITPRAYQEESIAKIWQYFNSGKTGNPLICYPTGTGKSLLPAIFIHRVMKHWPNQRFMLITSVKELIQQNAEVLRLVWPEAPLGIYSAGLKSKQIAHSIIFAGIQSAIKNPSVFGFRDIIWVDEAHLIGDNESSQYVTFLSTMKLINPQLKIIGLTATPYRMGMGMLTDGGLFTDIIHDLTGMHEFNKLISEGFLAPLVPKRTKTELDVSNVGIANGEYINSQLEKAVNIEKITYSALQELVEVGHNRRCWCIFSSGIDHAENIADMLGHFGVDCAPVHSKRSNDYNSKAITAWKNLELRSVVSYSKLGMGINNPYIDLIGDFRPRLSIPLHVQFLGRGTRPADGKENCIVLDYARNVPRLGPINDVQIPRKKGEKPGDIPVKICDSCGTYNHTKVRFCTNCGNEFTFQVKIVAKAGTDQIIKTDLPIYETYEVDKAIYSRRQKEGKAAYIRATYFSQGLAWSENVFPESKGYGKYLFHQWWQQRNANPPPATADEVLHYVSMLRCPKRIRVHVNLKFPTIVSAEY